MMTGGQTALFVADEVETASIGSDAFIVVADCRRSTAPADRRRYRRPNSIDTAQCSTTLDRRARNGSVWRRRRWRSPTDATTAASWNRRALC